MCTAFKIAQGSSNQKLPYMNPKYTNKQIHTKNKDHDNLLKQTYRNSTKPKNLNRLKKNIGAKIKYVLPE